MTAYAVALLIADHTVWPRNDQTRFTNKVGQMKARNKGITPMLPCKTPLTDRLRRHA